MKQHQDALRLETRSYGIHNVTQEVARIVAAAEIRVGVCTVFVAHTSASLMIQENADPDVLSDLQEFMRELVPEARKYRHADEGPDDMPSHIRSVLTSPTLSIPVRAGQLALGTWQAIYLWEHRMRPHSRELIVHVVGE